MPKLLAMFIFIFMMPSWAEYRVFELAFTNEAGETQKLVLSTLDHIQYPFYNPVNKGVYVRYKDSWMCWEDSPDHIPFCPNPKTQDRVPASAPPAPATPPPAN